MVQERSGMDHTAFNLQRTPCLPLPRKRSPDGASTECGGKHLIVAHYSNIPEIYQSINQSSPVMRLFNVCSKLGVGS